MRGLYAITDSSLLDNLPKLTNAVTAALQGGCAIVQYRDKSTAQQRRLQEALALRDLCRQYQATFLINDDIDLAYEAQADGVHLGQGDANVAAARQRLGSHAIIGVTCHDQLALAQQAATEGADYVAFGRFYASQTKPNASAAPLSLLAAAKQHLTLPVVAIGGINIANAADTQTAGADMLAVCHHLFGADSPQQIQQRAKQFSQLWDI